VTPLITKEDLAEILGVKPKTVEKWVSQRVIPFVRINKTLRFDPEAVIKAKTIKPEKLDL
jgi:excisionase family DNA binding protein